MTSPEMAWLVLGDEDGTDAGGGAGVGPAARLPVRAGFCSHVDDEGRPVFDCQYFPYFWAKAQAGDLEAWATLRRVLARKRAAGITHIVCDPPDGTVYEADWIDTLPDWMPDDQRRAHFLPMVAWILAQGFVPVIYCYAGGQPDVPNIYNGNLRRMLEDFVAAGWADRAIYLWAWESFGGSEECRARQNWDAWALMRQVLGPSAFIAGHVDSAPPGRFTWASFLGDGIARDTPARASWLLYTPARFDDGTGELLGAYVEDDDPSGGDEIGAMRRCPLDLLFTQTPLSSGGPTADALARQEEGWERFAPPGTFMSALGREVRTTGAPDWFGGAHRQPLAALDRVVFVLWEPSIAYSLIRGWITATEVRAVQAWADGRGIVDQGCLPA